MNCMFTVAIPKCQCSGTDYANRGRKELENSCVGSYRSWPTCLITNSLFMFTALVLPLVLGNSLINYCAMVIYAWYLKIQYVN